MISSMRVDLTPEETAPIFEAWAELIARANDLLEIEIEDAVAMLNGIATLNMAASAARSAISNGWYLANKRAFPGPEPGPRAPRKAAGIDLQELGLLEDDVLSALGDIG